MPVLREGAVDVPTWTRAVGAINGTALTVGERLQRAVQQAAVWSQEAANLISAFLTPAAVLALAFGLWRLGLDLGWTEDFPITRGLFSHWLPWIGCAAGLEMTGKLLKKPVAASDEAPDQSNSKQ